MADSKEYEATVSHTLLDVTENVSSIQPPNYGTVQVDMPSSVVNKLSSETVVVSVPQLYGHDPMECICWNCHNRIVTRVGKKIGLLPWLLCVATGVLCCWIGCCLIPFCIRDLKDTEHYCPKCDTLLARKTRI